MIFIGVAKGVTIAVGAYFLNTVGRICISFHWVQIPLLAMQDAGSNPYQRLPATWPKPTIETPPQHRMTVFADYLEQ